MPLVHFNRESVLDFFKISVDEAAEAIKQIGYKDPIDALDVLEFLERADPRFAQGGTQAHVEAANERAVARHHPLYRLWSVRGSVQCAQRIDLREPLRRRVEGQMCRRDPQITDIRPAKKDSAVAQKNPATPPQDPAVAQKDSSG